MIKKNLVIYLIQYDAREFVSYNISSSVSVLLIRRRNISLSAKLSVALFFKY